jgi:hypothetical protein
MIMLLIGCNKPLSKDVSVLQADVKALSKQAEILKVNLQVEQEKMIILTCESKFRHDGMWGDNGKSFGIAQFQKVTFDELKKRAGRPNLNWYDMNDQLFLLDWSIRNGYAEKWTCSSSNKKGRP